MVWFTFGHTIYMLDRLTDLRPTEGLQDFEFRWGSRNYSSYVGVCPSTFFGFSLDAPYFSASALESPILGDYWFFVLLAVFLVEGISTSERGLSFSIPVSNNLSTRSGMIDILLYWERCIWVTFGLGGVSWDASPSSVLKHISQLLGIDGRKFRNVGSMRCGPVIHHEVVIS